MKLAFYVLLTISFLFPNDKGFIYGKIKMRNGDEYQGVIRWGKDDYGKEHFWADSFNSNKMENEFEDYIDYRDLKRERKRHFFGFFTRSSRHELPNHQFVCYFGDIKKIVPMSSERAEITMKDDIVYEVRGDDAGNTVIIIDEDTGRKHQLKWRRIDEIEFMETPENLKENFGMALYGEVETEIGTYKGLIQWDYDESLSTDELNGDEDDFEFYEIKTIEKNNRRSVDVILNNGRRYNLSGTNDVDDDNRGILIKTKDFGTVIVQWREFISVTFDHDKNSGPGYSDFTGAKKLYATVDIDGETVKGRIAFDLDESYDFEQLEGDDDDVEFNIPFRNIASLENLNRRGVNILLKSGKKLKLYDRRDVSEDNDGLLIWTNDDEDPLYVKWRDVNKIEFE